MATSPLLIIVQGAPASGKTTLVRRLEKDLACIALSKDDIKEFLFDRLPQSDRAFSTVQGQAAVAMMYAGAALFLDRGYTVIIESAFFTKYARSDIEKLLDTTKARAIEIYCFSDEAVRQERFIERARSGTRHHAHLDDKVTPEMLSGDVHNPPIDIGDRFNVDTTNGVKDKVYDELLTFIKGKM